MRTTDGRPLLAGENAEALARTQAATVKRIVGDEVEVKILEF